MGKNPGFVRIFRIPNVNLVGKKSPLIAGEIEREAFREPAFQNAGQEPVLEDLSRGQRRHFFKIVSMLISDVSVR
jgi:hypothetical protein